ncbi:hypothetical protein ACWDWS_02010 [Streptomyces sp. NPDC003328]
MPLPLAGIDPVGTHRRAERRSPDPHFTVVGPPARWTAAHDAELVVLRRA